MIVNELRVLALQLRQRSKMREELEDDEIDLRELFLALWSEKMLIIAITFSSALCSVAYALLLPNIYESSALLSPAESSSGGVGGLLSQYSGLASMAGVSLPGGDNVSKAGLALEVIKSRAFIRDFISKHKILPELFAVDYWDESERQLIFDTDLFDEKSKAWMGGEGPSNSKAPTNQEAYEKFISILGVDQDRKTNLVTISIRHESPDIAQQWVEWLMEDVNETMRRKEIKEAEESIEYLKLQAAETTLADLDQVLFELMQTQTQKMMLAEVRREYVLNTIDPAIAPELRSEPKRAQICIFGTLLGGIIAVLISLIRYYTGKKKDQHLDVESSTLGTDGSAR